MSAFSFEELEINGHRISAKVEGENAHVLGPEIVEHLKDLDDQRRLGDSI